MNKDRFTISTTLGIASALLLIAGLASISILNTTHAQSATLGEPIFVEKESDVIQKRLALTDQHTLLLLMEL